MNQKRAFTGSRGHFHVPTGLPVQLFIHLSGFHSDVFFLLAASPRCFDRSNHLLMDAIFDLYGGPYLPRQNLLFHGKTYFLTAKLTFSRQNLLFHGKTYFSTAKRTFPRQNLLFHGKTYFLTAKLTFSRQNLLFHGKTYFSTAKLTFSRQNLLPASSLSVSTAPRL